jgi:hypothetical protein
VTPRGGIVVLTTTVRTALDRRRHDVASNLLNLVLDPLLIFGAKIGLNGAALATAASQVRRARAPRRVLARRCSSSQW